MTLLETIDTPVGSYAPDFELPGVDNQVHHLSRYLENFRSLCVISMCNRCPYVESYLDKLKNIQAEFASNGFTLIGLNGNDAKQDPRESFDNMKVFAQQHNLNFPYLWDPTQDVTRSFGVVSTPTAFLIDHQGIVRYKGQIDDRPQDPLAVKVEYLRTAIAALFQGQPIQTAETPQVGTALLWRR
ncbi:MAG TPA: thioredoxin family protein [Nostocaceae cyanobacterium]|nr:thioredoxin family protein [Nostocaceae cyanobacterium]